jgi:type II secretory pathway pseudopilin PulG
VNPRLHRKSRRRRGLLLLDTIIGLTITSLLGLVLVVGVVQAHKARERLEDTTEAVQMTRRVMATLQEGGATPKNIDGAAVRVLDVEGGAKVAGRRWVEVAVDFKGRTTTLVGLAPQGGGK